VYLFSFLLPCHVCYLFLCVYFVYDSTTMHQRVWHLLVCVCGLAQNTAGEWLLRSGRSQNWTEWHIS